MLAGAGAPTVLNAANEVAVAAFLARKIGFLDIAAIVEAVLTQLGGPPVLDLGRRAGAGQCCARGRHPVDFSQSGLIIPRRKPL